MNETRLCTIEQIEQFLGASAQIEFSAHGNDAQRYEHISRVLKRFDYPRRPKRERGILLRYLRHTSGYSRAQITRLIARWHANRLAAVPLAKRYRAPAAPFARKYTPPDIELLAEMDKANEDVCGPAIAHLLQRAYSDYGDTRYERLEGIFGLAPVQPAQKRGLPSQAGDFHQDPPRLQFRRDTQSATARRQGGLCAHRHRPPRRSRRHQRGVHITCVDEVCQWQVEACVQGISSPPGHNLQPKQDVATPGSSRHESGTAFDLTPHGLTAAQLAPIYTSCGVVHKALPKEPWHVQ